MADSVIRIVNARQNNLQGVTVDLPHRALTVVTGPSGSGKSTLAFDTLYAEGQRRYIESLSTYAKQFLERMPKPLVDRLEGLAPSVAIEQRNPVVSSRSTVGHGHRGLRLPPPPLGPDRPELLPRVRRRRSGGTRPNRRPTPSWPPASRGCRSPSPSLRSPDWRTRPWWRTCARSASSG